MTLLIKDRVKEITTSTGTGPIVVGTSLVTGFQSIASAIGDGNTAPYVIEVQGGTDWEIGIGQYVSSNTSLLRLQVLASSNSNNLVNFSAGPKNVFVTLPAAYAGLTARDLSQFSVTTSAQLASIITDETGTGKLVFSNNAVLVAPDIGTANGTSLTLSGDLNVSGNIYISGNTTTISANNLSIDDSLIYLANSNPDNLNDIGIVGHFVSTKYQHTGFVRDATDGVWKLFSNVSAEPSTTVDFSTDVVYDTLRVGSVIATTFNGALYGNANTVTNGIYSTDTGTVTNTMLSGGISNAKLSNSSITVSPGTGLNGGGTVALGSSVTLNANSGSTSAAGILQLNDTVTSTSTTLAATANAAKTAYDLATTANTNTSNASVLTTGTVPNARLVSIPNSSLANSSVTVGTTAISLGSSSTTLTGLTAVNSTSFVGVLTGNADTATKLQTARQISLIGGVLGTATSFDGSINIQIPVTQVNSANLSGTISNALLVSVPNSSLANSSVTVTPGTGLNGGGAVTLGSSVTLNANTGSTTAAGIVQLTDSISSTSTTTAATANSVNTVYNFVTTVNTNASNASNLTTGTLPNARLSAVPNSSLANSFLTIGTTVISLGSSSTTLEGLTSVTSTSFIGVLSGNATTATTLQTARTIALSGGAVGTATSFDGSGNITIPVTQVNSANLSGTISNTLLVSIPNSSLANTSVTITPGTGLNGGGIVALGSSITVNANTGSTSAAGILQLTDSISSTSTTTAATPNSVKTAYDLAVTANVNASNASVLTTGTVPNARLVSIPNSSLANSSITVGTTAIPLGSSNTTLVGLTSVNSTSFVGALTGNSDTATKLQTARTIALSGAATGTATSFDGSGNITIPVTTLASANLSGTISNTLLVSIPNSSLANSSVTVTSGTGLNGGGTVALGSSITINANTGSTSAAGILQLNDTVSSTSTTLAATANAAKTAYDLATTANTNASNASNLTTGTVPNARLVSIPNSSLANTSVTVTPGTGLNGGGTVALGSSITLNANSGSTTAAGILQLNDTVTSTSTTLAATANSVNTVYNFVTTVNTNASNASNLTTGTVPNARLVSVPNSSLANSSVTVTPGTGLNGGGTVALGSSITVNANTGSTTAAGILQLNDTVSSTSTTLAATANSVKTAYDLAVTGNTNASNASVLTTGTVPNARLVSVPNSSLANSSVTVTPGTGLNGGGTVALGSSVTLNANTGSTTAAGILQLTDSISSTSTTTAATANSVKTAYDLALSANTLASSTSSSNASNLTTGTVPNARLVSVPNSSLANSSVTVTPGTGLNGGGIVDLGSSITLNANTGSTTAAGILQLTDSISSTSTTTAATPNSVKSAYDLATKANTNASNASNLTTGTLPNARLVSIPNSSLANSSVTVTPGTGLNGGGTVALGSSITLNANSGSTTFAGILQLNDTISSTSTTLAATANAVKTAYDLAVTANTNASNASVLTTGTVPNARLVSIPNSSLANGSITVTPGTGLNGGGTVALGSSITLNANSGSTTAAGILQLNDTVSSTSTSLAATPNSVKTAYDLATTANTNASNASVLTTGTVPNARLVSIPNSSLANTSVTVGTTAIPLGSSSTTLVGLTSITSTDIISSSTTNATNPTTAPVTIAGGLGVAKTVYIGGDLNVSGNVFVSGNTTTLNAVDLTIDDPMIYLANNNSGNINDIGIVAHFVSTKYQHTGLVRDATDGVWKLFSNVSAEPSSTVDFATDVVYDSLKVGSLYGNANTATTLQTARTIALSGAATGTATSFDGSGNITIPVTTLASANLSGTISNALLVSIPNSSLANSSVTVTPGTGLNGGGAVALGSSITVNANTGSTSAAGILQLNDTISSTSTTTAATPNSVKTAYDLAVTANTNASNASVLTTGTVPNARLVSIPNSSLANSSITVTPGTGLNGGGAVALGSSITINANTGSTTAAGILQLNDTISSTSTTLAATANVVKTAYDLATTANTNASNASVLTTGTLPNARLVSIPNSSLANTSVTVTPGTGLNGGGAVALGSSITVNANTGSTTAAGILQLNDTISSTSTTLAATANAVKTAYDLAVTANTNASNASVLTTGTVPNARLVSIPNSSLANSSITVTPGTGLNGGGTVALGSTITLNANTGSTTAAGILQLTDSISSTSTTTAATPNSITNVYNFANSAYNKANTAIYTAPGTSGNVLTSNGTAWVSAAAGAGSMVYPGAGIPNSTGSAWGTSYSVLGTGSVVLSTAPANGELLIGNGTSYTKATLTQGSGISITNGAGTITIAATGGGGGASATYVRTEFTATASQTTFGGLSYTVGFVEVFLNGILLNSTDYTATNGTSVVLASGATAGDIIETIAYNVASITLANVAVGGTGVTTLSANSVILGNGTGPVQTVAPGASGNTLISNGTTWTSAAPTVSSYESFTFGGTGTPTTGTAMTPYLYVARNMTCINAVLIAKTAPTGNFTVSILRSSNSGTSFPDTIATITITSGNKVATTTTTTALVAGDLLRLDISAVNAAADWTAQLNAL